MNLRSRDDDIRQFKKSLSKLFGMNQTPSEQSQVFVVVAAAANRNRVSHVRPRKGNFLYLRTLSISRSAFARVGMLHQLTGKRFSGRCAHRKDAFQATQRY